MPSYCSLIFAVFTFTTHLVNTVVYFLVHMLLGSTTWTEFKEWSKLWKTFKLYYIKVTWYEHWRLNYQLKFLHQWQVLHISINTEGLCSPREIVFWKTLKSSVFFLCTTLSIIIHIAFISYCIHVLNGTQLYWP